MDKKIEQQFVERYIAKNYQERLLWELSSAKRRSKALSRFSHDADDVLDQQVNPKIITSFTEICERDKTVYILSWDENDGMNLPFDEAIRYCESTYMSVVLIGKSFALIKEETEKGTPNIFYVK